MRGTADGPSCTWKRPGREPAGAPTYDCTATLWWYDPDQYARHPVGARYIQVLHDDIGHRTTLAFYSGDQRNVHNPTLG